MWIKILALHPQNERKYFRFLLVTSFTLVWIKITGVGTVTPVIGGHELHARVD